MDNVTVILRECGERTADSAHQLLGQLFEPTQLHRVHEVPFSKAVRTSFEIGLQAARPWTLCIDADVLVYERGLRELLAVAALQDSRVFELQGFVGDKFFGTFRPAGNHLYRTEHLPAALQRIPAEGTTTRPEHTTIVAMRETGLVDVQLPSIVGIHDYEQHFTDIYRKCFLQAHKHVWMQAFLVDRWQRLSAEDDDFRIALAAWQAGLAHTGQVLVDKRFGSDGFAQFSKQQQLQEKQALPATTWSPGEVARAVHQLLDCAEPGLIQQQSLQLQHFFVAPRLPPPKTERNGLAVIFNKLLSWRQPTTD